MLPDIWMQVRVFDGVLHRVSSRKRHSDDEIGSGKTQQNEHEEFARPAGQKVLQHRDGTLAGIGA